MQKIVCGVCGLANLESFPTYPLCAGCGARLPQIKKNPVKEFFQRPVKTLVWAFCMGAGVATLALLSIGIARETRLRDRGPLFVKWTLGPDNDSNSADDVLQITVSTSLPEDREAIRNLRLRFDQEDVRKASIRVISPPAAIEDLGGGRYFKWSRFGLRQTIKVRLRPHEAINFGMVADGFDHYTDATPPLPLQMPPSSSSPNRSN